MVSSMCRLLLASTAPAFVAACGPPGSDIPSTGWYAAAVGDVNADGHDDLALTTLFDPITGEERIHSWLLSGQDGRAFYVLAEVTLRPPGERGAEVSRSFWQTVERTVVGIGDVDGDGGEDLALALPFDDECGEHCGAVRIVSGKNGGMLRTLHGPNAFDCFGMRIAGMGDVDGDSVPDLAVVSQPAFQLTKLPAAAPRVSVFSGASGERRFMVFEPRNAEMGNYYGQDLARLDDVDGDGVSEFAVSNPDFMGSGQDPTGRVFVHSGKDGKLLQTLEGMRSRDEHLLGWWLASAGDFDSDGSGDLLAASGRFHQVRSGRTGERLATTAPLADARPAGDVDGDGRIDWIGTLKCWTYPTSARVVSSKRSMVEFECPVDDQCQRIGCFGTAGDVDADGRSDVFVISDSDLDWDGSAFVPDWGVLTVYSSNGEALFTIDRGTLAGFLRSGIPVLSR